MTEQPESTDEQCEEKPLSLLPQPDMGIRIKPAHLARMLDVSRQTVHSWVKEGKLTLDSSGLVNPTSAVREVLAKSDPSRIRARVLKPLVNDVETLRRQLEQERARADLAELRLKQARASEGEFMAMTDFLSDLIVEHEADFRATANAAEWQELADAIYEEAEAKAQESPVDLDKADAELIDRVKQAGQVGQWDSDEKS